MTFNRAGVSNFSSGSHRKRAWANQSPTAAVMSKATVGETRASQLLPTTMALQARNTWVKGKNSPTCCHEGGMRKSGTVAPLKNIIGMKMSWAMDGATLVLSATAATINPNASIAIAPESTATANWPQSNIKGTFSNTAIKAMTSVVAKTMTSSWAKVTERSKVVKGKGVTR